MSTLQERRFGKYTFRTYRLLRDGLLLGGLLKNSESWIHITEKDIEHLERPDTILQRDIFSETGNPSNVFMILELGVITVRFVLMQKRMMFLYYILK